MTLLDNNLVRKYFSPNCGCITSTNQNEDCVGKFASNILRAMQEPIKKGERYLQYTVSVLGGEGQWTEQSEPTTPSFGWHPFVLRLPDRFQKKECPNLTIQCSCGQIVRHDPQVQAQKEPTPEPEKCIGGSDCHHFDKPKDDVEEKINFILDNQPMPIGRSLKELRELVELARKMI